MDKSSKSVPSYKQAYQCRLILPVQL